MIKSTNQHSNNDPVLRKLLVSVKTWYKKLIFNSSDYWEKRYINGGTSGAGSYGHLATFKADVLNRFVTEKKVNTVIEFGFGDGNQLMLASYPNFIGYDVSKEAVTLCRTKFANDKKKSFHHVSEWKGETAELVLSLDVIYHLVEDHIYFTYMRNIFAASSKYVGIYSSNKSENTRNQDVHVRHRNFTEWVSENAPDWIMFYHIANIYPSAKYGIEGSFADFFFYEKV